MKDEKNYVNAFLYKFRHEWKFLAIGGSTAVLSYIILNVALAVFHSPTIANILQAIVALETNFFLNHYVAFQDYTENTAKKGLLSAWGFFHLGHIATIAIDQGLFFWLVTHDHYNPNLIHTISLAVTTCLHYLWFRIIYNYLFKKLRMNKEKEKSSS